MTDYLLAAAIVLLALNAWAQLRPTRVAKSEPQPDPVTPPTDEAAQPAAAPRQPKPPVRERPEWMTEEQWRGYMVSLEMPGGIFYDGTPEGYMRCRVIHGPNRRVV